MIFYSADDRCWIGQSLRYRWISGVGATRMRAYYEMLCAELLADMEDQ